jgi:ribosomal protein S18 acetylase RimI-like enzyme
MPETIIRRVDPSEVAAYRELRLESIGARPDAFAGDLATEQAKPMSDLEKRLASAYVVAAFRDGKMVGTAGFQRRDAVKLAHRGFIWGVYVKPVVVGLGIGRRLIEALIPVAREQVEILDLIVGKDNDRARRLYERLGFRVYAEEPRGLKVGDRYYDNLLMALDF